MKENLTGKRIVILGLARQGVALARFAAERGAMVTVSDMRSEPQLAESIAQLEGLPVTYVLGEHPLGLLDGADMLAVSGGVPLDIPLVVAARDRGIPLSNDSQEFFVRCPAPVIGITGSAGKTTTTALLGAIGRAAGRQTWVGGNIGRPLISDLDRIEVHDLVVQELSSFQLQLWRQSPPIAAVLNITPNHLDRHKSMAEYSEAKANIIRYQTRQDVAVLAADDPGAMALNPLVHGRLRQFSIEHEVDDGAFIRDNSVWLRGNDRGETAILSVDVIPLRGRHNLLNVCAAVTLADSAGLPLEAMVEAVSSFQGVAHRLELVETIRGVQYVNDSIATAPERALAALASFEEPLILLAGGKDKNMSWDNWTRQVVQRVKAVVLFGELAPMLEARLEVEKAAQGAELVVKCAADLEQAVALAAAVAETGDVVLLAPGGTSYDAYEDFDARGRHFRALVGQQA
ncbi:MAG: UDP-N-acetylmuramoyl-L-alanine--D-glutamate ligase [Candidatus Promineifilaceae bacterium]